MSNVRPEETVSTKTLYSSGSFLSLKELEVRLPDGKNSTRIIVEHPQAVAVLPVLSDGRLVLIRQYRKAAERTLLEVPAGLIDQGEEPEQTARREMKEETGYDIGSVEHLVSFYTSPGFTDEFMHLYLAKDLRSGKPTEEIDEIEVAVMSLDDALERVATGEIADAKSILALLWCAQKHQLAD